jgi:hypothetical protein
MSRIPEYSDGPRHPLTRQMRQPFVNKTQQRKMEAAKRLRDDKEKVKKYEKKISAKVVFTIAGATAALIALNHSLPHLFNKPENVCPVPKKFAVAKPPPAGKYPPVVHPKCNTTMEAELEELREMLKDAEDDMKALSKYKRSTFVQKVKAATKDS